MKNYLVPLLPLVKVFVPMIVGALGMALFVMFPETHAQFCVVR